MFRARKRYFAKRPEQTDGHLVLKVLVFIGALAVLIVGQVLNAPVLAQSPSMTVVQPDGRSLSLEINKGRLIRLGRNASNVFIANPDVADIQVKSSRLVYVFGKKSGQTTLYAVDQADQVLASTDITVSHNLSGLRNAITKLGPSLSDIQVSSVDGALVMDGIVRTATDAENLRQIAAAFVGDGGAVINRVGLEAPNQVNLRVRIAEVSKDVDKQFGFNWQLVGDLGGFALGFATVNPFGSGSVITTAVSASKSIGGVDVNATVDALQEEGLITILAEPNLTALSGETASFLAGGEFPIVVPRDIDDSVIEFKQFGVSLAFTPTIIGEGRINLNVRPEVSELSNVAAVTLRGFQVPSLTTRRAETTVELGSGQSFAIAGLLQNDVTHSISETPGLGDIPVLGPLFRSDQFQRSESELVIIVTPYLVRPTSSARLSAPTDGFQAPHDVERIIGGADYRKAPKKGQTTTIDAKGRSLYGPVGFQLD